MHHVQHTLSTVYTDYSIHLVLHTPCTSSSPNRLSSCFLPSLPSPSRPYCTQFSTFEQIWDNQGIQSQLPWRLPSKLTPPDFLPSITAPFSTWSRPPSASANSLDYELGVHLNGHLISSLQVYLQSPLIRYTKCNLLNSLHYGLAVHR